VILCEYDLKKITQIYLKIFTCLGDVKATESACGAATSLLQQLQ